MISLYREFCSINLIKIVQINHKGKGLLLKYDQILALRLFFFSLNFKTAEFFYTSEDKVFNIILMCLHITNIKEIFKNTFETLRFAGKNVRLV